MKISAVLFCLLISFVSTAFADSWSQYIQTFTQVAQAQNPPVRPEIVERVVKFMTANSANLEKRIVNRRYVILSDLTRLSTDTRLTVLDLQTGGAYRILVSHGWGSGLGPKVFHCSNRVNSYETPPGFHVVLHENPRSRFGSSLYMKGLEDRNDNSYKRAIVFHPNMTMAEAQEAIAKEGHLQMSEGCTQITREDYATLKPLVQGGSLLIISVLRNWTAAERSNGSRKWMSATMKATLTTEWFPPNGTGNSFLFACKRWDVFEAAVGAVFKCAEL